MSTIPTMTQLAYITGSNSDYTITIVDETTHNGFFQIVNASRSKLWIRATWTAVDASGNTWSCGYQGDIHPTVDGATTDPEVEHSLLVGIGSAVTDIAISVGPGGGDPPSAGGWIIENSGLSVTDSSSKITITDVSTIGDPFGESSPSTLNVVCSMGQILIENSDTSTGYYLYFSDPTAASSSSEPLEPVEIASAPTTTVPTLATVSVPSEASIGFLTTMGDPSTVVVEFIIRHTDSSVVILEELHDSSSGQAFGRAIPAIIECSASNNLYVVNISPTLATASVSGHSLTCETLATTNFTVAPHGGVYVVDVSAFSDEHQVWLNWDVAGDPKMVIMRPTRPPPA